MESILFILKYLAFLGAVMSFITSRPFKNIFGYMNYYYEKSFKSMKLHTQII